MYDTFSRWFNKVKSIQPLWRFGRVALYEAFRAGYFWGVRHKNDDLVLDHESCCPSCGGDGVVITCPRCDFVNFR
jgi:hypothetical protein